MTPREDHDRIVSPAPQGPHGALSVQCTARAKGTGERCRRAPIRGATVCFVHGGMAPQVRAKAARRLEVEEVEAEIRNALAFESLDGVSNPVEILSELAARALATERALSARVNELAADDRLRYRAAGAGTEQLRAEVGLWERWHKQAASLVETLAKLNLDERRVRLTEAQGNLVAEVLRAIFARLALSPAQQALIPVVVPEELRRLAAAPGDVVAGVAR